MVSLLPFATAWIARTRLASSPVVFYAGLFVCIDIAYNVFGRDVLAMPTQLKCPSVSVTWRDVDHSLSLRFSRQLC